MEGSVTTERLEDQLAWYGDRARLNQGRYKLLKVVEIAAAALVSVVGVWNIEQSALITALLGATVVVLEGVQHVYQYQSNWVAYRATAESLKREKYLHAAAAGAYANASDRDRILAERIEDVMSQEHTKWSASHETQPASQ